MCSLFVFSLVFLWSFSDLSLSGRHFYTAPPLPRHLIVGVKAGGPFNRRTLSSAIALVKYMREEQRVLVSEIRILTQDKPEMGKRDGFGSVCSGIAVF